MKSLKSFLSRLKKIHLRYLIVFITVNIPYGLIAQKITWDQLFRLSKASFETRKSLALEYGFDQSKTIQLMVNGSLSDCMSANIKMQNNLQGVWYENLIFCPNESDLVYGTENSTYYQELKTILKDRYAYVEVIENESNGVLHFKKDDSDIEFFSKPKEAGITQHLIKLSGKSESTDNEVVEIGKARYFALIIAEEKYKKEEYNLSYPKANAESLQQVLINKYNFPSENIILLKESPTRNEIYNSFDKLIKLKKNDNLLIFFAGHGLYDSKTGQGYWLSSDYSGNLSNTISNLDLQSYLKKIRSHHILVISDACYSGSLFNFKQDETGGRNLSISEIYSRKSRQALTSGELEPVPDKSVFFESFMRVLNENESAYIMLSNLVLNIEKNIQDSKGTSIMNKHIYGRLSDSEDYGGEFILIKN